MITSIIFDRNKNEMEYIRTLLSKSTAHLSDDRLEIYKFLDEKSLSCFLDKQTLVDLACVEITMDSDVGLTQNIRNQYVNLDILVISDSSVSPMKYMTPLIKASSLLLRPFRKETAASIIFDFLKSNQAGRIDTEDENFVLENQDGKTIIPYSQIYYFEVRDKKLYIQLKNTSYSKYGTLDQLEKELPEEFFRCHRSFIVNTSYMKRVKLSENLIYLTDDMEVPLSRSYKASIKEYINERKK